MKNQSISIDQARYATSIVVKYMYNSIVKTSKKFNNTSFPPDIIYIKADTEPILIAKVTECICFQERVSLV